MRYIKCTRVLRQTRMKARLTLLSLLHLLIFVQCELFWNFPRNSKEVLHAYVNEKAHTIQVFPSIQVKLTNDSKLCSISLLASDRNNVPSFIHGNVLNQEKGYGYLTFNGTLYHLAKSFGSLEARTGFYHLRIIAEDCSNPPKSTKSWPITFEHIQSDLPIWSKTKYTFEIDSLHRPGYEVGKVTAYTSDINMTENNNFLYGDDTGMCAYTIQDPSYSFAINGHGVIRSLIRFNNHTDMLYEFNVTGFDCHLPIPYSSTVPVTVYVKAMCVSQWNGIPKEIEYSALSNPYPFASNAKFSICPQRNNNFTNLIGTDNDDISDGKADDLDEVITEYDYCPIEQVTLRMKILWSKEDIIIHDDQTNQPSPSLSAATTTSSECDLDYYSLLANRKTCILSSQSKIIDLLPDERHQSNDDINLPIVETIQGINELPKYNNKKSYPSNIYYFNGSMYYDINKYHKFHKLHHFDNQLFTINFWMKHSSIFNRNNEKNLRENILCSSDEYVCDSNWHHYSLTYRPPETTVVNGQKTLGSNSESDIELQLYLDGRLVPNNPELVQIAENMPMVHLSVKNHEFVRTSVGACWHGRSAQFAQHFVGYLAGLTYTNGYIQSDEEILCLTNCEPRLIINDPTSFSSNTNHLDTTNIRNSHLNSIIIQTKSLNELSKILRNVTFYNPRLQYKPRYRPEPVAIQLNTLFTYATDCEIPSTFNQVILISPLPPTEQTLISLDTWNSNIRTDRYLHKRCHGHHNQPSHDYQQSNVHQPASIHRNKSIHQSFDEISTSLPVNSLVLFNAEQYEHVNKTFTSRNLTKNSLSTGVYIFPYITIMWKTPSEVLNLHSTSSEFQQTISSCTIDLCKGDQFNGVDNILSISEYIILNPEYIKNDIKVFQRSNGFLIHGSSGVLSYMNALKHVQWLCKDEQNNISRRCFNVSCEAMLQVSEKDPFMMRKVNSNAIQSEFYIYHGKSSQPSVTPSNVQQHSTRLSLRGKPRLVNKRDINSLQPAMHLQNKTNTWSTGILLLISSSVLAVLLILFVAIKRIHRVHLKSNHFESQTQNLQMTPFDINALKQQMNEYQDGRKSETSAEKLRNSRSNDCNSQTMINHHQQHENEQKHQPLRITPNPFVNQSDMKEYEAKTILLDEKRYDATLNMSSSIYNNNNNGNLKSRSPIVCSPTIQFYENPLRSDEEDDDDFQCSCNENDLDDLDVNSKELQLRK
ncbi:unnamed protein product [Schistosoma rodhaini]|uniref:Cadherin domain-containing protein n=1 Tax=Schistosoma rodhaini TaxID=6188 RepID=A0AA85FE50_9TREM|nr:unnamed protein product [Schistosoma rodhaini]